MAEGRPLVGLSNPDEILDVNDKELNKMKDEAKASIRQLAKDVSQASAPKQICVGVGVGWLCGYVTMKAGKFAATALGGSFLLLQVAQHKGYVSVNWDKLSSKGTSLAEELKAKLKTKQNDGFVNDVKDFVSNNAYVAGGFMGGFLLGMASS